MLRAAMSWVRGATRYSIFFLMCLILPAALGPGIYWASDRNDYQKQKKLFWGIECGQPVRLTTSTPYVSRLPRQCWIFNISQLRRTPWPVTGMALLHQMSCLTWGIKHSNTICKHDQIQLLSFMALSVGLFLLKTTFWRLRCISFYREKCKWFGITVSSGHYP
jgi:hypothetical protein